MNTKVKRVLPILIIAFSLAYSGVNGQETSSAKAVKYFEKAVDCFRKGDMTACQDDLIKAIQADSTYADPYIMMGDIYQDQGKAELAADYYRRALRFNPEREDIVWSLLANTLYSLEQYAEASIYYEKILNSTQSSQELKTIAEKKLEISLFRKSLIENPVSYNPVNIGKGVNTGADEYINALAADGSGIYFTRRSKNNTDRPREFIEDYYFAAFSADSVKKAVLLDYPPGKQNDAGALCISPDGRLLFFTSCFRADSYGSCDLYYSEKQGNVWSVARNMGSVVNSAYWDSQPSVSPDGKTLYFASSRPGGKGGSDIWKTVRNNNGDWSKPVNIGAPVNTPGEEMAPFIHFDNQTLYFCSGGHPGMGGADLFRSSFINSSWTEPGNLGYPVNSSADELVIIVNAEGDQGYISCNNLEGAGGYDIYRFELSKAARPVPVSYLKGKVYDKSSGLPLEARFELIDIEQDSVIVDARSDRQNGEFLVCLPCNRNYALNVSCDGYLFYSDHFPLSETKSSIDPVVKDIPLEPVAVGKTMILRNIFYDTDQYQLKPESFAELDKLLDFLKNNLSLWIEIGGHTDDQGTEDYNAELSLKRAQAVFQYLIDRGTEPGRISCKGYGESKPVSPNDSEEGRAQNRRTEITIMDAK
jgi:outer membrane protein OmpA-like peptidoglycan-associated protein/tetratricopeptide (TPR) repeat protein